MLKKNNIKKNNNLKKIRENFIENVEKNEQFVYEKKVQAAPVIKLKFGLQKKNNASIIKKSSLYEI
jgi:hypothetical protein